VSHEKLEGEWRDGRGRSIRDGEEDEEVEEVEEE
jgi:hypothetical protein